MRRPHLSKSELVSIALSIGALGVSIWAAIESQQASIQARRSEVRAEALITVERFRQSISRASCVLHISGVHSEQEKFKRFKADLGTLEITLHRLQSSKMETLDKFEAQLDTGTAADARVDDAVTEFKLLLSSDELSRANEVCGVKD